MTAGILKSLDEVEYLLKHMPGRHDQQRHAGTRGGEVGYVAAKYTDLEDMPAFSRYGKEPDPKEYVYSYGNRDAYLSHMIHDQGFDGLPQVVSSEELDKYVSEGDIELFRGLSGEHSKLGWDESGNPMEIPGRTSADFAEQFRNGDYYLGSGLSSHGTYTTRDRSHASQYKTSALFGNAPGDEGTLLRMTLRKEAKIANYDDLSKVEMSSRSEALKSEAFSIFESTGDSDMAHAKLEEAFAVAKEESWKRDVLRKDMSRLAVSMGYDAIKDGNTYIILNRTALRVQDDDL